MVDLFAFYGLEASIELDPHLLRGRFLELSKQHHPDFFVNDEKEYEQALEMTSLNNTAYKTLSDLDLRIQHMLQLKGELDGKDVLPPDFLMEMMDLNEEFADARLENDTDALDRVQARIGSFENELEGDLHSLASSWSGTPDQYGLLRTVYLKRRYLRRLRLKEGEM